MPAASFVTHSEVAIDPSVPVPEWPLSSQGIQRMRLMLGQPWIGLVRAVFFLPNLSAMRPAGSRPRTIPTVPALPMRPVLLGESRHSFFRINRTGAIMPISKASRIQITPRSPTSNKILRWTGTRSSRPRDFPAPTDRPDARWCRLPRPTPFRLLWLFASCVVVLPRGAATRIAFGKSSAILLMAESLIHAPDERTHELRDELAVPMPFPHTLAHCRTRANAAALITGAAEAL